MRPNTMAALMAYSVRKERFKIYQSFLFLANTNISYGLKNMLEPDYDRHVIFKVVSNTNINIFSESNNHYNRFRNKVRNYTLPLKHSSA
jgi:hypothetical protein